MSHGIFQHLESGRRRGLRVSLPRGIVFHMDLAGGVLLKNARRGKRARIRRKVLRLLARPVKGAMVTKVPTRFQKKDSRVTV